MKAIRHLFPGTIAALVFAMEVRDKDTAGHARRTAAIAVAIGKELGLPAKDMADLHWGSLLHDIGKVSVARFIQNKPGPLTGAEYEQMIAHSLIGARIIKPAVNNKVAQIVEHHHDRYDGRSPYQVLSGETIPLAARILAVADSFDAMTSHRPYRPAMSKEEALDELGRCSGTQFDPLIVRAFQTGYVTNSHKRPLKLKIAPHQFSGPPPFPGWYPV